MKLDKGDITGFILGIVTSVVANWVWDMYREKKHKLEYSDKKIIQEMSSQIEGLKKHINDKLS
jgi:uncharacterized membrane protein YeaQ/YmgE (transglycosylase-associated protein family)